MSLWGGFFIMTLAVSAFVACGDEPAPQVSGGPARLDALNEPGKWRPFTAPGTTLSLGSVKGSGRDCLRMTYDFGGTMSFLVAVRDANLDLPAEFELSFFIKRSASDDRLELKLVDASDTVHMFKWYEFGAVGDWKRVVARS
ncbi:MAG TPA: hypothetical protein VIH35_06515, partial [Kiritimatiellia bacterium]